MDERASVIPNVSSRVTRTVRCMALLVVSATVPTIAESQAVAAAARPAAARTATANTVAYVRVGGADYQFEAPEAAPAGIVTFNLVNTGGDLHALAVFELPANRSVKDFLDQYHAQGMIPSFMVGVGQTTTIAPRAEAFLTARLKPGRYILACLIPARDGRMHTEKGMVKLLTVK